MQSPALTLDSPFTAVPVDAFVEVAGWQLSAFEDGACTVTPAFGRGGVLVPAFLTAGATVDLIIERGAAAADRPGVIARVAMVLAGGAELDAPVRYTAEGQETAHVSAERDGDWRCHTLPDGAEQVVAADGEYDRTAFGAAMAFVDAVGTPAALWAIDQARDRALARP